MKLSSHIRDGENLTLGKGLAIWLYSAPYSAGLAAAVIYLYQIWYVCKSYLNLKKKKSLSAIG